MTSKAKELKQKIAADENDSYITNAKSFTVVFKYGPQETFEKSAETLEEAKSIANQMNSDLGKYGKRAAIYAIDKNDVRHIVTV